MDWQTKLIVEVAAGFAVYVLVCSIVYVWFTRKQ